MRFALISRRAMIETEVWNWIEFQGPKVAILYLCVSLAEISWCLIYKCCAYRRSRYVYITLCSRGILISSDCSNIVEVVVEVEVVVVVAKTLVVGLLTWDFALIWRPPERRQSCWPIGQASFIGLILAGKMNDHEDDSRGDIITV